MDGDFAKYLTAANQKVAVSQIPVTIIENKVAELEIDIDQLGKEIKSRSIKFKHKEAYYKTIDELILQIDEITKSIDRVFNNKYDLSQSLKTDSAYFVKDLKIHADNNQIPGLESACVRNIREVCESISSYFTKEYHENAGLGNDVYACENENIVTKDVLWVKTEEIFNCFSANKIHSALLSNIKKSTNNLIDLSSRIDLRKDADKLKFMFETGKLKDVSTKPALMRTVHQLIEEGQVNHFKKFLGCENALNQSWKLEKKLNMLNKSIDETLSKNFDDRKAGQIRELFSLEQENQTSSASIHYLQDEIIKLQNDRQGKKHAVSLLMKKLNRIQNFDRFVQGKQLIIQQMIKNNGSSKGKHRQQHQDVITLAQQKISKCQEELPELSRRYQQMWKEELECYEEIPIACLQTAHGETAKKQLKSELPIYRTDRQFNQPGVEYLKKIESYLKVPAHASTENFFPAILQQKREVFNAIKESEDLNEPLFETIAKLTGVQESISQSCEKDTNATLPTLQDCQFKCHDIMTETLKLRNTVQAWWEQPAQHVAPWITEDGRNVTQYLDQFSSQSNLLKKIQLVK